MARIATLAVLALVMLLQWTAGIPVALGHTLRSALLVTLYLLAARRAGLWFTAALGVASPPGFSVLAGTALLSLWPLLPGSFGLLHPLVAAAPLILLPLCMNPVREVRTLRATWSRFQAFLSASAGRDPFVLYVTIFAFGWALLAVLAPPSGMDTLTYHLGLSSQYLVRGSLVPPDTLPYYFYWQGYSTAILPLLALDLSGEAVNLLGFVFLVLLYDGVRRLGGQWGSPRAGLYAAAAVVTSPMVLIVLTHTKDDIISAAFLVWAFLGVSGNPFAATDGRLALRRAFLLGAALAVKPTNIIVVLPALLWEVGFFRRSPRLLIPYAAALCLLPGYWAARNLILLGRPFSPEMIHFSDPPGMSIPELVVARLEHVIRSFFSPFSLNIDGPIGPLILVLSALAFMGLKEDSRRRQAAFLGAAAVLLWLALGFRQSRFLLPLFLLLAASGAAYAVARGRSLRHALLIVAIVSLGAGVRTLHSNNSFLSLQIGKITADQYMLRWLNSWSLQTWANEHLPPQANLVSVGETRFFPLKRQVIFDGYWQRSRVLDWAHETHSETRLAARLGAEGFTHLFYNPPSFRHDVEEGHSPPPRCARDLGVFHALLADSALVNPLRIDRDEPWQGIYALRPPPLEP